MRELVKDIQTPEQLADEAHLCRWMRASGFVPEKAAKTLRKATEWRREIGVDTLELQDFAWFLHEGLWQQLGVDVRGNPIHVLRPRNYFKKDEETSRRWLVFLGWALEYITHQCAEGQDRMSLLFDFEGWGYKNTHLALYKEFVSILINYFPERLGVACIVNSGWTFKALWTAIRPILDTATYSRVRIIADNSELDMYFPKASLPEEYGGTMTTTFEEWSDYMLEVHGGPGGYAHRSGVSIESLSAPNSPAVVVDNEPRTGATATDASGDENTNPDSASVGAKSPSAQDELGSPAAAATTTTETTTVPVS